MTAALLLCLCLLSACAAQTIQIPTLPPAPDDTFHDDPARDAQLRLLTEAHRAYSQARYPSALLFFTRFIERSPDSPRMAEARWWLGRTHEQVGDVAAAMAQYRILASGPAQPDGSLYEEEALRRLDELRQRQADRSQGRQLGLRVAATQLPPPPLLTAWLQEQRLGGATALIVDPDERASTALPHLVAQAHRAGLALWVSVDVHQPRGLAVKPDWLARTAVRSQSGEAAIAGRPDLAHAGYQAALVEWVRVVSASGCDGLFLPARSAPGFSREFSNESFSAFAASFGVRLSPEDVLGGSADPALAGEQPDYWRWTGWKALAYAQLAGRLRGVLRERHPSSALLIEVHQASLGAPVDGLEHYGEDVTGLAQRTGAAIVVRRDGAGGESLIDTLRKQLGPTDRVWVEVPTGVTTGPPSIAAPQSLPPDAFARTGWPTIVTAQ